MPETDKDGYPRTQKPNWVDIGTLIVLSCTLVAVVIYAWIAHLQWVEMRKSTNAAIEAVTIADKALKANIESGWQDRRPWVGLQRFECTDCTEIDRVFKVGNLIGVIANMGRTPAVKMSIGVAGSFNINVSDPIPDFDSLHRDFKEKSKPFKENMPPEVKVIIKRESLARAVLPPNAREIRTLVREANVIRPEDAQRPGRLASYVVGKITYYSTGENREHITTFCLVNYVGPEFRFCPTGNSMD